MIATIAVARVEGPEGSTDCLLGTRRGSGNLFCPIWPDNSYNTFHFEVVFLPISLPSPKPLPLPLHLFEVKGGRILAVIADF